MALILPSAAVGQIAGSVGNLVFSQGFSGPTVRLNVGQISTNSAEQSLIKGSITTLSKMWATLTPTQRASWTGDNLFNKVVNSLNQTIYVPGNVAFIRVNAALKAAGIATPLKTAPSTYSCGTPNTVTPTWDPALQTLTVGTSFSPAPTEVPIVWCTKAGSAGKNPKKPHYYTIQVFPAGTAGPYDITGNYLLKRAIWIIGTALIVMVQFTDNTNGCQGIQAAAPVLIT